MTARSDEPATPSFVVLHQGAREIILLGGSLEGRPALPARILDRVTVRGRVRWLPLRDDEALEDLRHDLLWRGLAELDAQKWLAIPQVCSAETLLNEVASHATACADDLLREFEFFDPTTSASHFRSRLRAPNPSGLRELLAVQRWVDEHASAG